jgi:hypothetical protein
MHKNVMGRAGLALLLWSVMGTTFAQEDSIKWWNTYEDVIREAKRTNKPIFLEFRCEP